jgi:hypothetical protein
MPHTVTISTGHQGVVLPNGHSYNAGDVALLSDEEYDDLTTAFKAAYFSSDLVTGGASLHYSVAVGDGAATTFTVNHALNTLDVVPACREIAGTKQFQFPTFASVDENNITVTFGSPPTANQFRITVVA